jgi:hypothetical protein
MKNDQRQWLCGMFFYLSFARDTIHRKETLTSERRRYSCRYYCLLSLFHMNFTAAHALLGLRFCHCGLWLIHSVSIYLTALRMIAVENVSSHCQPLPIVGKRSLMWTGIEPFLSIIASILAESDQAGLELFGPRARRSEVAADADEMMSTHHMQLVKRAPIPGSR